MGEEEEGEVRVHYLLDRVFLLVLLFLGIEGSGNEDRVDQAMEEEEEEGRTLMGGESLQLQQVRARATPTRVRFNLPSDLKHPHHQQLRDQLRTQIHHHTLLHRLPLVQTQFKQQHRKGTTQRRSSTTSHLRLWLRSCPLTPTPTLPPQFPHQDHPPPPPHPTTSLLLSLHPSQTQTHPTNPPPSIPPTPSTSTSDTPLPLTSLPQTRARTQYRTFKQLLISTPNILLHFLPPHQTPSKLRGVQLVRRTRARIRRR